MIDQPTVPRFDKNSTAAEVLLGIDLSAKRVLITGASSGLGVETARVMAGAGAHVTIAVRNTEAGRATAQNIADETGANVDIVALDLLDRNSIKKVADDWEGPLDILINNAGIMALPALQLTPEGWETHFATNHLGHFALVVAMHAALAASPAARVVSVASATHHQSPVIFEDIHFAEREYNPWSAYGQSKTANILMAVEAAKRWAGDGISVNAIHPGAIYETGLLRHVEMTPEMQAIVDQTEFKTVEQGAATQVFVATSPSLEGVTGRYFSDCNEAAVSETDILGVAPYAYDPEAARRLWELSLEMLNA